MDLPRVAALVLNYNRKEITEECIASLLKSDYQNLSIFVIDNGSNDNSACFLKQEFGERISVIQNQANLGYSEGFNRGLERVFDNDSFDYACIFSNDVLIDRRAISELVSVAKDNNKVGFVTGKVYYYDRPDVLQTAGKKWNPGRYNYEQIGVNTKDIGQFNEVCEREIVDDVFWLVSRQLYKDTGGYSPIFFIESENFEWELRAKKKGFKIMYTPYSKIWHRVSFTIGKHSSQKIFFEARNPLIAIMLHEPPYFFRNYFWHSLTMHAAVSLNSIIRGRFKSAFSNFKGVFSAIWWGAKNKKLTMRHFI